MAKERLYWLDNLRAILILLVVFRHCGQFTNPGDSENLIMKLLCFNMPLFMFVSGFSSGFKNTLSIDTLKDRFFQLIIPFCSWAIIVCLFKPEQHFIDFLLLPKKGLWFLYVLFLIISIHTLCFKLGQRIHINSIFVSGTVSVILILFAKLCKIEYFAYDLLALYFPWYLLGYYTHIYCDSLPKASKAIILFSGLLLVILETVQLVGRGDFLQTLYFRMIVSFIACVFLFYASQYYLNSHGKILSSIGVETMGIYSIHIVILTFVPNLVLIGGGYLYYFYVISLFLLLTLISFYGSKIIRRNKVLSHLLLGSKI